MEELLLERRLVFGDRTEEVGDRGLEALGDAALVLAVEQGSFGSDFVLVLQAEQDGVSEVGAERGEQASRRRLAAGVSDADAASELLAQLRGVGVDAKVGQFRDAEVVADFEHGIGDGLGGCARRRPCGEDAGVGQLQDDCVPGDGVEDRADRERGLVPAEAEVDDVEQCALACLGGAGDDIELAEPEVQDALFATLAVEDDRPDLHPLRVSRRAAQIRWKGCRTWQSSGLSTKRP